MNETYEAERGLAARYRVVYAGLERDDEDGRARFVESLVALMNVPRDRAWALVNSGRACLKKACPQDAAERLGDRLRKWGARVIVQPVTLPQSAETLTPTLPAAAIPPTGSSSIKPSLPLPPPGVPAHSGGDASWDQGPYAQTPSDSEGFGEETPSSSDSPPTEPAPMEAPATEADAASPSGSMEAILSSPEVAGYGWQAPEDPSPEPLFEPPHAEMEPPAQALDSAADVPLLLSEPADAETPSYPADDFQDAAASEPLLLMESLPAPPEWADVSLPALPDTVSIEAGEELAAPQDTAPLALEMDSPRAQSTSERRPPRSAGPEPPVAPMLAPSLAVAAIQLRCTECGSMEPEGAKTCSRCCFPLATRKKSSRAAAAAAQEVYEGPARNAVSAGARATPRAAYGTATGHGELEQCFPVVLCTSLVLWGYASANILALGTGAGGFSTSGIVSTVIDVILGISLLKGSGGARKWVLVRSILGGVVWGGLYLMSGDPGAFFCQAFYAASLVILLNGRGSMLKAFLVGIPNMILIGLALLGLTLIGGGSGGAGDKAAGHLEKGSEFLDQEKWSDAAAEFDAAIRATPSSEKDVLLQAHLGLGAAHLGGEDFERALPPLQKAVELDPEHADAHYLLAVAYYRLDRSADAMRHLDRVRGIDPDYPGLEDTTRTVQSNIRKTYY